MRFDLLFVNRHRHFMPLDPAARVISSAIKRSYTQHATQFSPSAQNIPPPPAKRSRHRASPHSTTSKYVELAARLNNLKSLEPHPPSSPKQSSFTSSKKGKKKRGVPQSKHEFPGPYHSEAYIVKEYNRSILPLKQCHKETPKSSVNNFYQMLHGNGKQPKFTSMEGEVIEGDKRMFTHR
jgi:hypothetical protein